MPPGNDETGEFAVRLRDPGDFREGSFRRITLQAQPPQVFEIIGRLKDEDVTALQGLRFLKVAGWTRSSVRDWMDGAPDVGKGLDVAAIVAERMKAGALVWERDEEDRVAAPDLVGEGASLTLQLLKSAAAGDVVYKSYRASELKAVDSAKHIVDITISTNQIDRDREVVLPEGMRVLKPKRIPLVSSHDYRTLLKHIGEIRKATPTDGGVQAQAHYFAGLGNQEADWGWQLVELGVAAYSIGFIPEKVIEADTGDEKVVAGILAGKIPLRTYAQWELVEASHVVVPSNRGAVQNTLHDAVVKGLMTVAEEQTVLAIFAPAASEPAKATPAPAPIPEPINPVQTPAPEPVKATSPASVFDLLAGRHADPDPALPALNLIPLAALHGQRSLVVLAEDGTTELYRGSIEAFRELLTRREVEVIFRGTKTFDVQVEADEAVDALEAWGTSWLEKLQAVLTEHHKSIPSIPADSPAYFTGDQFARAVYDAALAVADKRIDETLGKALGIVEYHPRGDRAPAR